MKYLVNRETKEHRILHGIDYPETGIWYIVDADDEGWIKWAGKSNKCPLPNDAKVSVRWNYSDKISSDLLAGDWSWNDSQLSFYRPILPAESNPALENTWDGIEKAAKVDVFTRLASAVAASESIPALIAEINAMLPEGYEVRGKAKPEAVTEDMSDWRNWKAGDVVIRDGIEAKWWTHLGKYTVHCVDKLTGVYDNDGEFRAFNGNNGGRFKFHSRPEAK